MRFFGSALGWNLFGAVLGEMLETLSQATGIRCPSAHGHWTLLGSWTGAEIERGGYLGFDTISVREEHEVLADVR